MSSPFPAGADKRLSARFLGLILIGPRPSCEHTGTAPTTGVTPSVLVPWLVCAPCPLPPRVPSVLRVPWWLSFLEPMCPGWHAGGLLDHRYPIRCVPVPWLPTCKSLPLRPRQLLQPSVSVGERVPRAGSFFPGDLGYPAGPRSGATEQGHGAGPQRRPQCESLI